MRFSRWAVGGLGAVLLLSVVVAGFAGQAEARTVMFGLDRYGGLVFLPPRVCAYPGQQLRLLADELDPYNRRQFEPAENFGWTLYHGATGVIERWSPTLPPSGSFGRGVTAREEIRVRVPQDIGANSGLEAESRWAGQSRFHIFIADPRVASPPSLPPCEWAGDIYVDSPSPDPGAWPCHGRCEVGAKCTDGCPRGARCNYVQASRPYWRVLDCR